MDELAEVTLASKHNTQLLLRVAQIGRAAGVHLLLATQRPSVQMNLLKNQWLSGISPDGGEEASFDKLGTSFRAEARHLCGGDRDPATMRRVTPMGKTRFIR